jgi:hypothetical protein
LCRVALVAPACGGAATGACRALWATDGFNSICTSLPPRKALSSSCHCATSWMQPYACLLSSPQQCQCFFIYCFLLFFLPHLRASSPPPTPPRRRCAPGPCLLPTVQAVIGTVSSLLRHPTLAPRVDLDATSSALTAAARTGGGRPFPRHLHDEVVTVLRLMKLRRQGSGGVSAGAATGETAPSASAVGFV